jgi:hypothetical protein
VTPPFAPHECYTGVRRDVLLAPLLLRVEVCALLFFFVFVFVGYNDVLCLVLEML